MRSSGSLCNFFFTKLYQFKLSTVFHRYNHAFRCIRFYPLSLLLWRLQRRYVHVARDFLLQFRINRRVSVRNTEIRKSKTFQRIKRFGNFFAAAKFWKLKSLVTLEARLTFRENMHIFSLSFFFKVRKILPARFTGGLHSTCICISDRLKAYTYCITLRARYISILAQNTELYALCLPTEFPIVIYLKVSNKQELSGQ